jgi:hypothetical protein
MKLYVDKVSPNQVSRRPYLQGGTGSGSVWTVSGSRSHALGRPSQPLQWDRGVFVLFVVLLSCFSLSLSGNATKGATDSGV